MKKIISFAILAILFVSCSTNKDILYFQDIKDQSQSAVIYTQNKIQVNDILSITVSALNPESALPFNTKFYNNSGQSGSSEVNMKLSGYLVNSDGTISFPILGNIQVLGKTTTEVEKLLKETLIQQGQLTDPFVNIRITNGKITILGDVVSPGTYPFYEQNITLIQAIGFAGDLNLSGKRNDILIIREEDGQRTYGHIDLRKTDLFNSPFYHIKQNDVIYVNPNGPKVHSAGYITNYSGLISLFFTAFTLYILLTK